MNANNLLVNQQDTKLTRETSTYMGPIPMTQLFIPMLISVPNAFLFTLTHHPTMCFDSSA